MTTRKITLSLPEELLTAAENAVKTGKARSMSAYVAERAGAGQARMDLAEVMDRWDAAAGPVDADQEAAAEQWAQQFMDRNDARAEQRGRNASAA
jgi:Arc/MetJ-type ribon-helix-helix transcriptional regulator